MRAAIVSVGIAVAAFAAPDCSKTPLLYPDQCCKATAPASFDVQFQTGVGNFTVHVERKWSPYGADRFYSLSKFGYWGGGQGYLNGNEGGFFRVVPNFVVQWGIGGQVPISAAWANEIIPNDPVILSNVRGTISYAAVQDSNGMACNRTTQVYINYANNTALDGMGFTPFGTISAEDMKVVDAIYAGYGQNPDQDSIYAQGDAYLKSNFPKLTYTHAAVLL